MAKLPDWQELGATPRVEAMRPRFLGRIDLSPMQRAVHDQAQAGRELGGAISNIGTVGAEVEQQKGAQQYTAAHAQLSAGLIDLNTQLQNDTDYATAPERYGQQVKELVAKNTESIEHPGARQKFTALAAPMAAEANARIDARARGLYHSDLNAKGDVLENRLINSGVNSSDDGIRRQSIDAVNSSIDSRVAAGALTPLQGQEMKRHRAQEFATADVLAAADSKDPARMQAVRDKLGQVGGPAPGAGDIGERPFVLHDRKAGANVRTEQLDQEFSQRLNAAIVDAEAATGSKAVVESGRRTTEEQADAYGRYQRGEIALAAPPGKSRHEKGLASDIQNGPVLDWLHKNAATYGLEFLPGRLGQKDPGHIQMADQRQTIPGGQAQGPKSIYDIIPADVRQRLINHLDTGLRGDRAGFTSKVNDTVAEAFTNGETKNPLSLQDFQLRYGAADGQRAYTEYTSQLQLGRDISGVAQLPVDQQQQLLQTYAPVAGQEGFAGQAERQQKLNTAIEQVNKEKKDPGNFALRRLPAAADAFTKLTTTLSSPQASDADRSSAARTFAATTLAEQGRVGIPDSAQQILPKSYIENFAGRLQKIAEAEDPADRLKMLDAVQAEAKTWGTYWPRVLAQLNEKQQPIVRAIGAGADPIAMARLLSQPKGATPGDILKEQNDTAYRDLQRSLNDAMKPFKETLVGGEQIDHDYSGYEHLARNLAALYVRDGDSATVASDKAFKALIGDRYDFRDTFRVPKEVGVVADDVQQGALLARSKLAQLGAVPPADNLPGRTEPGPADMELVARDGKWITAPNQSGLNLIYTNREGRSGPVLGKDGKPFLMPWADLVGLVPPKSTGWAATWERGATNTSIGKNMPGFN